MKQIHLKPTVRVSQIVLPKISQNLLIYFLFIMTMLPMLTLPGCATTYGKAPKRLANDEIITKIYKSGVAKQEVAEIKLKKNIDKVLSDNNYADYIVLHQCNVNYRIKFFKTLQDKYVFLSNIHNDKYLDSLQIDTQCNDVHITEQVVLFKKNNLRLENTTKSKLVLSTFSGGTSCNFAKGGGKYFMVMNYATSMYNKFGTKHILKINLKNGAKIQFSPFPNFTSEDKIRMQLVRISIDKYRYYESNEPDPRLSFTFSDFLYPISLDQLQEMAKYEITSITVSDDSKEILSTKSVQSRSLIKNDAQYIIVH